MHGFTLRTSPRYRFLPNDDQASPLLPHSWHWNDSYRCKKIYGLRFQITLQINIRKLINFGEILTYENHLQSLILCGTPTLRTCHPRITFISAASPSRLAVPEDAGFLEANVWAMAWNIRAFIMIYTQLFYIRCSQICRNKQIFPNEDTYKNIHLPCILQ